MNRGGGVALASLATALAVVGRAPQRTNSISW